MIDNITNVTPDGEQPVTVAPANEETGKEKKEKKDNAKMARNAAMGAAVIGAAGAGVAVAEAMQPGEAPEVVDEVVEVDLNENPAQAAAEFFGHKDAVKDAPEHKDEAAAEPDSDETAQLHEPDLEADGKEEEVMVIEPDEDGADEVAVNDIPESNEEPGLPEYIEQPDMGHIDVQIDESMNYDDAGDIIG